MINIKINYSDLEYLQNILTSHEVEGISVLYDMAEARLSLELLEQVTEIIETSKAAA